MGRFDNPKDYGKQASDPAAPKGLRQQARFNQRQSGGDDRFSPGKLQAWTPHPYVENAQSWYTGANSQGMSNGWNNHFAQEFSSRWDAALQAGTAANYFSQRNATGVVTWDHTSADGSTNFRFGDVFQNGKRVGNVYDQFDRDTANLMMAPWILDNDAQKRAFAADSEHVARGEGKQGHQLKNLAEEIDAQRRQRNQMFEQGQEATAFNNEVKGKQKKLEEGWGDEAIAAGGAAGGAALGAGVGTVILPGVGTAVGAAAGALIGGVGAWWNRDSLTEQAARADAISDLSYRENGWAAGTGTFIEQWSGFGGKMISPLSNLTQGIYDKAGAGTRAGDGVSNFYKVGPDGKNHTPLLMKAADLAASFGDSMLQFASPIGAALYTTQMAGTVGGQVAELGFSGGKTFDFQRGGFDNIFTDEKGNFDASSAAAGIANVGIDAVQLGFARGLAGKTNAELRQAGESAAYGAGAKASLLNRVTGGRAGAVAETVGSKLPLWMGGTRGLAAGERIEQEAGLKVVRDAEGNVVKEHGSRLGKVLTGTEGARATVSILAPSEALKSLSARVQGMRMAAKAKGAYTADDFFRAAHELTTGERAVQSMLVSAWGEGAEEVAQAILEPYSHGHTATASEVIQAGLYGAAAGAGMHAGSVVHLPSAEDRLYNQAASAYALHTGGAKLDRAHFDAMPEIERRQLASLARAPRMVAEAAARKIEDDMAAEHTAGVAGIYKVIDAIERAQAAQQAKATDRTDGAFVISQLEEVPRVDDEGNLLPGQVPVDSVVASANQTAVNLNNHMRGLVIGLKTLRGKVEDLEQRTTEDPTDTDAAEQLIARKHQVEVAERTIDWATKFDQVLGMYLQRLSTPGRGFDEVEADVAELNDVLRRAFNRQLTDYQGQVLTEEDKDALARAVSMVFVRDPQDQSGSYQVLVPQVSARLTFSGTDNLAEISHAILPAIRGDYDGDKIRQQAQLIFDDTEFASARSGAHFLGAGASVNVGAPKYEKYVVDYLSAGLTSDNLTLLGFAEKTLQDIAAAVRRRYTGHVGADVLDEVLEAFFTAVHDNDKDARTQLLDGLANKAGAAITEFSRANLSNEWLWLDQLIVSHFQRFQEAYAAHRPTHDRAPSTTVVEPNKQSPAVRTRMAEQAAVLGATLANLAPGDTMFRMFQQLHYTALGASVLSAMGLEAMPATQMAELYRELGQRVTRSELERVLAADDITGRVYVQLEKLAADAQRLLDPGLSKFQALVLVANLKVSELEFGEKDEVRETGAKVSLAQMLLKQSVMVDKRQNRRVLDVSPELQAKHARLEAMTRPDSNNNGIGAEQAFIEVVGAQQLYTLLGDDAAVFGPHQTVEQFIRYYASLSESQQRELARDGLKMEPAYLTGVGHKSAPYSLTDAANHEISAYRAVVDAILAVGNERHAEQADRSNRTRDALRTAHQAIRAALFEFAGLDPKREHELEVDVVRRMIEGNPDFARKLMNLIPNAAVPATFRVDDNGEVYAPNWLYTMFTISDPKHAEMHYWRNLLLSEWFALGHSQLINEDEDDPNQHARQFSRLTRRMHRVLYRLALPQNMFLQMKFMAEMESATDLDEFIAWVNREPGLRGQQAPFTAWVDDTAEFDADKANGGWTSVLPGAELREAVAALQTASENLASELVAERNAMKADQRTRSAIRRVRAYDRGESDVLDATDREVHDQFVKAIKLAADWRVSLGPQALIYQTTLAAMGFYPSAHTKGKNPPNVEAQGALDASRDAYDYVTNYERVLGSMTAVNMDAVGSNMSMVARDGGRTMDDQGRVVEWTSPLDEAGEVRPEAVDHFLDLLDKPETRPAARSVLFPQVLERSEDGLVSQQMLVGKSLTELLNSDAYSAVFPKSGRLSERQALVYASLLEGRARKYDGHAAVQRAANEIVIAKTAAADHALSESEVEDLTTRTYYHIAQTMQMVGAYLHRPHDPGTDPLAELRDDIRAAQRRLRTAHAMGMDLKDVQHLTDEVLDNFLESARMENIAQRTAVAAQMRTDPANKHIYEAQAAALENDFERFVKRINLLRGNDMAGQVAEMFSISGDAVQQATKKEVLVEYISDHLALLEASGATMAVINKLTGQMLDPSRAGQPDLTDKEWAELSSIAISHYLDESAVAGVTVSPWPDADHADDQRYFDSSFSYLIDRLLDSKGPLAQAARDIHRMAGQQGAPDVSTYELTEQIASTILDPKELGRWTGDIPRLSREANARLDSAAAAPAIAMAGNAPKRLVALIAATQRTFAKPDEALLSTVGMNWFQLNQDLFDEVEMTLPGVGAVRRPLAQLTNRFARSVTMNMPDGAGGTVSYDLLAEFPDLGRPWVGEQSVAESGYVEISVERLKLAMDRVARKHGARPETAVVNVEFFHPDSQPEGAEWFHNVYFEGTSFKLDADRHSSLLSTLWFTDGSISPAAQAAALDASKLGLPALQEAQTVTAAERAAIEANWATDLAAVLRMKTKVLLTTDKVVGDGRLDPEFYNAAYKDMKLRHFVRTTDGGLLTAEQVLAAQARGEVVDGELWIPTDDVLRQMVGEQGTQGVRGRVFDDDLDFDPSNIPAWRGVTPELLERFKLGVRGDRVDLYQTRIANRARQQQLVVRAKLSDKVRNAFDEKMRIFHELQTPIFTDRGEAQMSSTFDVRANLGRAVEAAGDALKAENLSLAWNEIGLPFGPRNESENLLSKVLLRDLHAAMNADGTRTGWIYREGTAAKPQEGLLSQVSLQSQDRPAYRVAPGDLVVVEIDSFNGDAELAKQRIDYLAGRGAVIVLGATDGQGDVRAEVATHLIDGRQYEPIAGSQHAFQPGQFGSRFQNMRARISTLTETRGITAKNRIAVFLTRGLGIQENAAWAVHTNERLKSIAVSANLVPTASAAGFNVPVTPAQIDAVRRQLEGLNTLEGRAHLKDQANGHIKDAAERAKADEDFDTHFTHLMDRFDDNPGVVLPQRDDTFGKGDIIPLVDNTGRIQLYRHGYKALQRWQVDRLAALPLPGSDDAANIAVFPTKLESAATVHTGRVVSFEPRAGYGLRVELDLPLSVFGDKKQLEWNGMKYVLVPQPASIVTPEHGFFPDWGIDLIGSLDDALSKESLGDMVNNHRNAFAYFGIDFLPDVTEFFFPGQRDSGDAQAKTLEMLHAVAAQGKRITVAAADELINAGRLSTTFTDHLPTALVEGLGGIGSGWVNKLADQDPVENKIAAAMLVYLMTPGAKVEDVLSSGGFNNPDSRSESRKSRLMPRVFTQIFDNAPLGSPLRVEINRRLNDQIHNPNTDGTGYLLHENFDFEIRNADPSKNMVGILQLPEAHSSGDNPIKNGMAFDETERQQVSSHSAAIAFGATGAETAFKYDIAKAQAFADAVHSPRDLVDGGAWRLLSDIPKADKSFQAWRIQMPAESARRELARDAMVQFRQEIDKDDASWGDTPKEREANQQKYGDLARRIVRHLGLLDAQAGLVDYWVRQLHGRPHGQDVEGNELGKVTAKAAIQAAQDIFDNVADGYLPVLGGEVPMLHLYDLKLIYRANQNRKPGWAPRDSMGETTLVSTWQDWVKVALGSALTTDNLFDPLYLLALDGFMHSYQNALDSLMDLPVSLDALKSQQLLDEDLNRMVVSVSDSADRLASSALLVDSNRTTIDQVLDGKRIGGIYRGKAAPAAEVAKRREARRRWRKENGVPVPVDVTMKNFRKNGAEFIDHTTTTNALVRGMIDLRVGMALLNPALYVSMGPEQWIRDTLDQAANLLTGQATSGTAAVLQAKASQALAATPVGGALEQLGWTARYTPDQIERLGQLYKVMGQRSDFKGMVYRDLMFQRPTEPGTGRLGRGLAGFAKFASHIQDPTWGMKATSLARRYMDAALQYIQAMPTVNAIDVDTLIDQMLLDPEFLKNNYPEAHQAATNHIANIRSLKQTTLSATLRGIYEPMANSSKGGRNMAGNLLLKMPLLFSGYAMNVLVNVTGLQGFDAALAMFLHGREKNGLLRRVQSKLAGEEVSEKFDLSDVLDGIDLSRAFIRGGLTHTALFALGMAAGGLNLSGEDDEMKKRRRLAQAQGLGMIYDPRTIENDFRNADALYLDNVPILGTLFRDSSGRSPVQMHWMLKQFLSPVMGMEKFFETGDLRHVTWGFEDALGSFPLINTMMWSDAVDTAAELEKAANDAAAGRTPADLVSAHRLLTGFVGVYERMLFENSFVNSIYAGMDAYDRDPYVLPLRDSDGTLQRDIEGNARPNDLAMETFLNDQGKLQQGYLGRLGASEEAHVATENRASMALVMSLFTGGLGQSDYWRYNMPIKTREIDHLQLTRPQAEAAIRQLAAQELHIPRLTQDEIAYALKGQAMKTHNWDLFNNVDSLAAQYAKQEGAEPLSVLDKHGREVLTQAGAEGVFRGLHKGSVRLGDESLRGLFIPFEMRQKIVNDWAKDLVQEGVDLGLTHTAATYRMKRVLYGSGTDNKGLAGILFAKPEDGGIDYHPTSTYAQLNTTYVMGPDGRPWATGFTRGKLLGALGLKPFNAMYGAEGGGTKLDARGNVVDQTTGMNTGLRGLVPLDDSRNVPTDVEIGKSIEKAIHDAAKAQYTPREKKSSSGSGGSGWRHYGYGHGYSRGYRHYGHGYGGGYGGGGGYFTRMNPLPNNVSVYGNSIPFINTSNPIIRRATIRRERVESQRGRLNQWQ